MFMYCGMVNQNTMEFVCVKIPCEVENIGYKTKYPYFTSKNISKQYFNAGDFDKKLCITDDMALMYSLDKNKIMEWLQFEKAHLTETISELLTEYVEKFNQLKSATITEKTETDITE